MSHEADLVAVKRLDALYLRAQANGKSRDWWRWQREARALKDRLGVSEMPARPMQPRRAA